MARGVQVRVRFLSGDEESLDGLFETTTDVRVHLTRRFPNSFAPEIVLLPAGGDVDLGESEVPPPLVTAVLKGDTVHHDEFFVKAALAHARAHDAKGLERLADVVRSKSAIYGQKRSSTSSLESEAMLCTMSEGVVLAYAMIEYLHVCGEECDDIVVTSLLNAHADVNHQDVPRGRRSGVIARATGAPKRQDARSALWLASFGGHRDTVQNLLCAGADVSSHCRFGRNCVAATLVRGNSGIVKVLVDHQCDINQLDSRGESPLIMACSTGLTDGVAALVPYANNCKNGAEKDGKVLHINVPDLSSWTPLLHASSSGHEDIANMLIESRAEVNHEDKHGRTALHLARCGNYLELANLLVQHGAADKGKVPRQDVAVAGG